MRATLLGMQRAGRISKLGAAGALALLGAAGGGGDESSVDVASLDLRGTRIDGSEDASAAPSPDDSALDVAVEEVPGTALDGAPDGGAGGTGSHESNGATGDGTVSQSDASLALLEGDGAAEAAAADGGGTDEADAAAETAEPDVDESAAPPRDENAELGHVRDDGVRELTFQDLSLEGIDYELLVDSLLFPEEYAEDGVELPKNIAALSGQEVAIQGYMIPGKIERGGNVRDFMLVRDLLACCFGGIPKPDEWIDVVMAEDADAEYIRYMPLVVTGTLTVGEDMDMDAFNPAVFKMVATEVRRRE